MGARDETGYTIFSTRDAVWSKKSCGLPVVVLQEAAQSLLAAHFAIAATRPLFSRWKKQNISSRAYSRTTCQTREGMG